MDNQVRSETQHRSVSLALRAIAVLAMVAGQSAFAQEGEERLKKFDEMELPSMASLLQDAPIDWVRLKNDDVIVCEPVTPRPDPVAKREEQIAEWQKKKRPADPEGLAKYREERQKLNTILIVLPNSEDPEYLLPTKEIEQVVHFEDLVLQRTDKLIEAEDQRNAYTLLQFLERREPEWPGLEKRKLDLLFMEAQTQKKNKQFEAAMVYLEQLHAQDSKYEKLSEALGEVTDELMTASVKESDYRRSRHYLGRLRRVEPNHPTADKWQQELQDRTLAVLNRAKTATTAGKHDEAAAILEEAVNIWPGTPGLSTAYTTGLRRWQRLHVAVRQLPGATPSFPFPTRADLRIRKLTEMPFFEVNRMVEEPRYRTRFFEQWVPTDLGRRIEFNLRSTKGSWESRELVTAPRLAMALESRLDPAGSQYDERLADFISEISVQTPYHFSVQLNRVPLRIESLFRFPLEPTEFQLKEAGDAKQAAQLYDRFLEHDRAADRVSYRRATPQEDGLRTDFYRIAEITEHAYESENQAVRDMLRGKIDMLARVRLDLVKPIADSERFFVIKYGLPCTHVLTFNLNKKTMRNRELRRALAYGVDRPTLLREEMLRGADSKHGRLTTAPFATTNYAYNHDIKQRDHDLTHAVALRLASRKQFGGKVPELKMVCDPDPLMISAASKMIATWKRAGWIVHLVTEGEIKHNSEDWDIAYRTLKMEEPLTELWPFITMENRARIASLNKFPDWLRQEFLQLDNAGDWQAARNRLRRLHRLLWAEVLYVPLWEIDEYTIFQKNIEGNRSAPIHAYQDVERWTITPLLPPLSP